MDSYTTDIHTTKKKILLIGSVCVGILIIFGLVWFFLRMSNADTSIDSAVSDRENNTQDEDVVPDPLPNDRDRDGIEDQKEEELGLSLVNPDTDGDALLDNDELTIWNSDPLKFDTDGDGFGDGWEVLKGYNPAGPGLLSIENN